MQSRLCAHAVVLARAGAAAAGSRGCANRAQVSSGFPTGAQSIAGGLHESVLRPFTLLGAAVHSWCMWCGVSSGFLGMGKAVAPQRIRTQRICRLLLSLQ